MKLGARYLGIRLGGVWLAAIVLFGCAEGAPGVEEVPDTGASDGEDDVGTDTGTTDTATPDTTGDDTGDDGDTSSADTADMVEGDAAALCVLNDGGVDGTCADPAVVDFGMINPGPPVERLVRVDNLGADALTLTAIDIDSAEFTIETVTFDAGGAETPISLPHPLAAGASAWAWISIAGDGTARVLPANEARFTLEDSAAESFELSVAMTGQLTGCVAGTADCDGDPSNGCEVDTTTDLGNCGTCGTSCAVANADVACNMGTCEVVGCQTGYGDCNDDLGADGCETDVSTDLAHCGTCGTTCQRNNATASCVAGTCSVGSCNVGYEDCDLDSANGCEQDIVTSNLHCGACNATCTIANAMAYCDGGSCTFSACNDGRLSCDGDTENGCEIDGDADEQNCGTCGTTCANDHGSTFCNDGLCTPSCDALWGNCDNDRNNGCEQSLATLSHCGGCNVVCDYANASESCMGGSCLLGGCDSGYGNCDGNALNGCETPTSSTVAHCGACGNDCSRPNTSYSCTNSACVFNGCTNGYIDLDNDPANGCEFLCTPTSSTDLPDDGFADANCDGIDGDVTDAVFVATDGSNLAAGTMSAPLATIGAGITLAASQGKDVYVSGGTYNESLTLANGVSIYGGYNRSTGWTRSNSNVVTVAGGTTAVSCANSDNITLDHLTIQAASNTSTGGSSYGVRLSACDNVTLRRSTVTAGSGGAGTTGSGGSSGGGGTFGQPGNPGCEETSAWGGSNCPAPVRGAGGLGCASQGSSSTAGDGGLGGAAGHAGGNGGNGVTGNGGGGALGGSGGLRGTGGTCDRDNNNNCTPGCWNGNPGNDGFPGQPGANGAGGTNFNTNATSSYLPANGGFGGSGGHGGGGGGGGGGHGGDDNYDSYGGSGGGGGGGGCGGGGASGGSGGGGSFALWVYNSTNVDITSSTLSTGSGGSGGNGGSGGSGGGGGNGGNAPGYGGGTEQDDGGCGAAGGDGGAGGRGGHGGGGGGGPSVGIVFRSCTGCSQSGNSFALGGAGAGGTSSGNNGNTGLSQNVHTL